MKRAVGTYSAGLGPSVLILEPSGVKASTPAFKRYPVSEVREVLAKLRSEREEARGEALQGISGSYFLLDGFYVSEADCDRWLAELAAAVAEALSLEAENVRHADQARRDDDHSRGEAP